MEFKFDSIWDLLYLVFNKSLKVPKFRNNLYLLEYIILKNNAEIKILLKPKGGITWYHVKKIIKKGTNWVFWQQKLM